jgi:hypothetical protein
MGLRHCLDLTVSTEVAYVLPEMDDLGLVVRSCCYHLHPWWTARIPVRGHDHPQVWPSRGIEAVRIDLRDRSGICWTSKRHRTIDHWKVCYDVPCRTELLTGAKGQDSHRYCVRLRLGLCPSSSRRHSSEAIQSALRDVTSDVDRFGYDSRPKSFDPLCSSVSMAIRPSHRGSTGSPSLALQYRRARPKIEEGHGRRTEATGR